MQLYAYMNAVTRQEDTLKLSDEFRNSIRFHQIQITTSPTADGAQVQLMNKNFTPENLAIQAALSGLGRLNPDTDEDRDTRAEAQRLIDLYEAEQPEPSEADQRPVKHFTYPEDTSSKPKGD